jgi:hypothetical protein
VDFADLAVGPAPQLPREAYEARRRRLAKAMGAGSVLVVATNTIKQYSNDVDYPYRPHSDFWYLTGFAEPQSVLVLEAGSGRSTLFLRERKPEAEIWTGRRLGVARAPAALGVDKAYAIEDLGDRLAAVLKGAKQVHAITKHDAWVNLRVVRAAGRRLVADSGPLKVGGPESALLKAQKAARSAPHARALLHDLRLVKDAAELRLLRRACDLRTCRPFPGFGPASASSPSRPPSPITPARTAPTASATRPSAAAARTPPSCTTSPTRTACARDGRSSSTPVANGDGTRQTSPAPTPSAANGRACRATCTTLCTRHRRPR